MVPQLEAPIVLVHGLLGFDTLRVGKWVLARYFPGIEQALAQAGNRVLVPRLSPMEGVAVRAEQLRRQIDSTFPGESVHIIGHSMGGLDARYMISRLGMEQRVLSLTTIGTPHRGTSFADWGIRKLERLLTPGFEWLNLPKQAFFDLTVDRCERFNEETPDAPNVRYFSVAGQFRTTWRSLQWLIPSRLIERLEGPNDGVVSVTSATYGEACEVWECDHLGLVNWPARLTPWRRRVSDRVPFYAALLQRLIDEGVE